MALTALDKARLGTDHAAAFENSIALVASRFSHTPGILDEESLLLERKAYMFLYGVLMQGLPQFWPGIVAIGSMPDTSDAWASRIQIMDRFYRHPDVRPFEVTSEAGRVAALVVPGLMEVFPNQRHEEFTRLRKGVNALIDGWKASSVLERLHAFVRALDGLLLLEKSKGEKQFVERIGLIVNGGRIDDVAREMFRLRSLDEHLTDWPSTLGYVKESNRPQFVTRRAFEAEVITGEAYRRVLSDSKLRASFRSASDVEVFWAGGASPWTSKIELDAQVARFRSGQEM